MRTACHLTLLGLLCAPGVCTAQGREWIVDSSSRPGAQFTNLRDAFAAARPGDLVRVRDGSYNGTPLDKGLAVLCEPGVRLQPDFTHPSMVIQNVPAGQQVVFHGFGLQMPVEVRDCRGRIVLDRLKPAAVLGVELTVRNAHQVQVSNCTFPTVVVSSSVATLTDCTLTGPVFYGPSALGVRASEVIVAYGSVRGETAVVPVPGILADDSRLTILGDAGTVIAAGTRGPGVVPAIQADGGSVVLDQNVQVQNVSGPPISGTATVTLRRLPALRATGAPPGGVVQSSLFSPAGDIGLFFVSVTAERTPVAGLGADLWLDPNLFLLLGVGVQGAGEHLPMSMPVPNDPSLAFLACTQQAASVTAAGTVLLSNPASHALR